MHLSKRKFHDKKQPFYDERVEKSNVMLQLKLKNIFNKNNAHVNWQKYKYQQKFCLILLKTKNTIFC